MVVLVVDHCSASQEEGDRFEGGTKTFAPSGTFSPLNIYIQNASGVVMKEFEFDFSIYKLSKSNYYLILKYISEILFISQHNVLKIMSNQ